MIALTQVDPEHPGAKPQPWVCFAADGRFVEVNAQLGFSAKSLASVELQVDPGQIKICTTKVKLLASLKRLGRKKSP